MAHARKDFHHPYEPYEIQRDLMNAIYECITAGQVGIFESPTEREEPDWVLAHEKQVKRHALIEQRVDHQAKLQRIRQKELRKKQRYANGESRPKKPRIAGDSDHLETDDEARFLVDDYHSEEESSFGKAKSSTSAGVGFSSASLQLMERLGEYVPSIAEDRSELEDEIKVYYCSRTHSQLTQFVEEVRRVDLPAPWTARVDSGDAVGAETRDRVLIKHLPLASRKNLCINPKVAKLGNAPAINERCLELQQPEISQDHKCPFVPNKENEVLVNEFRDHVLADIRDIEDLGTLGESIGICPYYAARSSIKPSEIVTLPYPLLLQKSAREALGISLKDHILVIDEAHNLMDAIANINAVFITHHQLRRSRALLNLYLQKFRNRLKGKNRTYVVQVVRVLDSLIDYLDHRKSDTPATDGIAKVSELMAGKGVDQINLYKLLRYLNDSKLARKVESYAAYVDETTSTTQSERNKIMAPALTVVQSFFAALTNPASEGCFSYERSEDDGLSLKYMLLDPSPHFREVVEEARAVILAGGTLSPMDDYIRHLFSYLPTDRLKTWSCGHIIPKENLIVTPVAQGRGGTDFDFTYERRNSPTTIDALGQSLSDLCASIPDGVVVFFPSYRYLDEVVAHWKSAKAQQNRTVWEQISSRKPIYQESKGLSGVENVLQDYSASIHQGKGGLLLSVIGGKMSEGINFSDRLGRGVIVVGLPFPNIQSAQWKAKLDYIEKSTVNQGGTQDAGKAAARNFYENACMRAVNQSIGRAIRHQKDYASIILLDRRYRTPRIENKLPGWIKQSLVSSNGGESWGDITGRIVEFFKAKTAP